MNELGHLILSVLALFLFTLDPWMSTWVFYFLYPSVFLMYTFDLSARYDEHLRSSSAVPLTLFRTRSFIPRSYLRAGRGSWITAMKKVNRALEPKPAIDVISIPSTVLLYTSLTISDENSRRHQAGGGYPDC